MEKNLTFDKAIELLEITDITKVVANDIPKLSKKSKKRWHPDKVAHIKDISLTQEYTINFQQIDYACQLLSDYLNGTYKAGEAFSTDTNYNPEEPEEIIRKNARDIQTTLSVLWETIKITNYRHSLKEVILSDGFKLKDLLHEDFREDLAMLSVVSSFYGMIMLGILTGICNLINPSLGGIVGVIWFLQAISCLLGVLPLSRFWLPQSIQPIMI